MQKALADELVQRILISLGVPADEALAMRRPRQQQRRQRVTIKFATGSRCRKSDQYDHSRAYSRQQRLDIRRDRPCPGLHSRQDPGCVDEDGFIESRFRVDGEHQAGTREIGYHLLDAN
jgi:hypothetical protein